MCSIVDISYGVDNVYSSTPLPLVPTINILVPSVLNSMPNGSSSMSRKYLSCTNVAVDISNADDKLNSYILSFWFPVRYILVPSGLKSSPNISLSTVITFVWVKLAVDTSKPVVNAYSWTLLFPTPVTNIFVPSVLNLTAVGFGHWVTAKLSTNVTVDDKSNPVDSVYSFTSSPCVPTINIFVPSVLNVMPLGWFSWAFTLKVEPAVTVTGVPCVITVTFCMYGLLVAIFACELNLNAYPLSLLLS